MVKQRLTVLLVIALFIPGWIQSKEPLTIKDDKFTLKKARAIESEHKKLVEKLSPAVITVQTLPNPESNNPRRKFGGGGGSGVIIDPRGFALSNFHVTDYSPINVGMTDGRSYDAKVVAFDEYADIVLIKIDEKYNKTFPYVELGDSDRVKVGDTTIAMGNPFSLATDFKPTTTMGVLSGLNRYLAGQGNTHTLIYSGILQTDTPINPGNSGGPLFDRMGQLIGINGRISLAGSGRRVNVGVGYAIPINMIKKFLTSMKLGKDATHGILGLYLTDNENVTIEGLAESSPAALAGILPGDEILSIDGRKPLDKYDALHMIISRPSSAQLTILVKRQSPLDETITEQASYNVTLKPRVIPFNLARRAKAAEIKNFDFVTQTEFLSKEEGAPDVLEQVMTKVREVNRDALNENDYQDGLVWIVESNIDGMTAANYQRAMYSDVVTLFKRGHHRLTRYEDYGVAGQMGLKGRFKGYGWSNSYSAISRDTDNENEVAENKFLRQQLWRGHEESNDYSVGLEKEKVKFENRSCFLLLESFKAQLYYRYIDRVTGVELGMAKLNNKKEILSTRVNTKWGRVQGKVIPLEWKTLNRQGDFVKSFRIHKIAYGLKLDDLTFEFQPGVFF